jgi:Spy/CpxP family protein refolding chaperone
MRSLALAALALAGLAMAAPQAEAQSGWLASRMVQGMCNSKAAPGDDSDRLAKRLNLTDAQKAALKEFMDASAASFTSTKSAVCETKPDLATAPGRFAFNEKVMQAQLDGLKAIEPKLQAFYDTLDDKQKKAFDSGGRVGGLFGWLSR